MNSFDCFWLLVFFTDSVKSSPTLQKQMQDSRALSWDRGDPRSVDRVANQEWGDQCWNACCRVPCHRKINCQGTFGVLNHFTPWCLRNAYCWWKQKKKGKPVVKLPINHGRLRETAAPQVVRLGHLNCGRSLASWGWYQPTSTPDYLLVRRSSL